MFGVSVGEKQVVWLELRARGAAGHGSQPVANNANLVLPKAIRKAMDLPPGAKATPVVVQMRREIGTFAVKARINAPSDPVDAGASRSDTPLFAAIRKAVLAQHPDAVATPMFVPFGTDSVNLRKRGAIAWGVTPMILDAATAAMHGDEERVPLAEFRRGGIRILFDILKSEF